MMHPDDGAADGLSDYLDALVTGNTTRPFELDSATAATVEHFFTADDAPGPPPGLADQLWGNLMHAQAVPLANVPVSPFVANGQVNQPNLGPRLVLPAVRGRWLLTQLVTAALVLLALVGSFIVLGPLRSRSSAWLPVLPAISGTPTAEGGIVTETLIDVPDASLPAGPVQIYSGYTELQPGVSASLGGQVGTSSYYVEQGTVRISHSGVEQIVHAGEHWNAPVAGVWKLENVGDGLARIVEADVNDAIATSSVDAGTNSKFSDPQGYADIFVIQAATTLPPGMGRVTLERLTLPPGTAMAPYTKTQFDWIGVAAGRVGVTLEGERLPFRWDPGEERSFGLYQTLPPIQPGTEMTLRNAGGEPLVLYHLTLTPGASAGTPAPTSGVITDDILVRATLEQMPPAGGTQQFALYRTEFAPGAVEPMGSQVDTGVANELFTVESGRVTVEADAPVFLTRTVADPSSTPSLVEPETAIALDEGDQLLAPSGVTFRRRNDGPTPATILGFSIGSYGDSARMWLNPPGVTYVHGLPFKLLPTYPAVPVEATVHRLTLAPGAELAIRDLPDLELVYVETGTLDLVYAKADMPATPERSFTIHAGSGTDTFGRTPEKALLANRGAVPLVLLTASVVSNSTGEATPQAP